MTGNERIPFESQFKTTEIFKRESAIRKNDILAFSETMNGYFNIVTNDAWQLWNKAKAETVPEGYVLLPRVPTEKMFQAYERYSVAPMSTLSKTGYKAMVEAAGDQNENS
ncbi:hypothetical protein ACPD9D_09250 [Acinetobacter baumannii]|uniref:Uncharacterized protein n=1 Tax=Acinetobacter baumannii (strain 1295743) TaxID=1310613 RepID=A0A009HHA6_ACIB9|nr:hypothetical protein [Acinetobacter baumannii]ETQ79538.1 hypothetical protein P668_3097 [Acinetobacter baumannii UH5207]EXB03572.1 hypothetical protein J512_3963 [Acinetobacter baumannii 1295743]EXG89521.1 hypothetical protein J624_3078 [Acinetobacter baumannii 1062314]KCX66541.1 hypothetical protein J560_4255 [Acinetobacter baumannii 855125]KNY37028.1 hypothetical protein RP89_19660 [Acinetobacter baumannii]